MRSFRGWLIVAALIAPTALAGRASAQRHRETAEEDMWIDTGDTGGSAGVRGPSSRSLGDAQRSGHGMRLGQIGAHEIPPLYSVQRGDTLWAITGQFYGDPYQWPRVWSYNPEITNPHWIYPDQQVRLLREGAPVTVTAPRRGSRIVVRPGVESGTLFLREQGWLDEDALETSGEIVGSPDDHMMLSPYDQAYVRFDRLPEGRSEPDGEYTVFQSLDEDQRNPDEEGTLVRILGTVRVDSYDPERRTARVTVTEALDPIERGYHVAAIPRRFDVVPPVRSDIDIDTRVVATLMPTTMVGDQQIVFVPVGADERVEIGHRFFVVRSGDAWRRDLEQAQHEASAVPPPAEPEELPDEVVAEARVVTLRPHSAGLLVTRATDPVRVGDRAQLRRGY